MKIFLRSAVSAATLAVLIDREQSRGARRANEVESGPKKRTLLGNGEDPSRSSHQGFILSHWEEEMPERAFNNCWQLTSAFNCLGLEPRVEVFKRSEAPGPYRPSPLSSAGMAAEEADRGLQQLL